MICNTIACKGFKKITDMAAKLKQAKEVECASLSVQETEKHDCAAHLRGKNELPHTQA